MSTLLIPEKAERGVFERGDRIYMTTPVQVFEPTDTQIEEYAFAKHVRSAAPNDNIVWLKGQYVEADNANQNGAQWTAGELAIKSLTPVLMPVTVMHDPRTAVGTIAHAQLVTPDSDKTVKRARIDTILALWAHRFPEAVTEALENAKSGRLMQSMECFSPWYECSVCSTVFHKLPRGAEQAQWCDHLKASNPHGGFVDLTKAASGASAQRTNASRILGDVCFTGTGLIYGSRGARGAYSEAHLNVWQEEVASFHRNAHDETASSVPIVVTANYGGSSNMGLVQIDESELATLRKERDDARAEAQKAATEKAEADRAVTEAETAKATAETAKTAAEKERDDLKEEARQVTMRDKRMGDLGDGFVAKLGDRTKESLKKTAATASDEDWNVRLEEIEEIAKVKRDAKSDEKDESGNGGGNGGGNSNDAAAKDGVFEDEEIAAFVGSGVAQRPSNGSQAAPTSTRQVVGGLFDTFAGKGEQKKD